MLRNTSDTRFTNLPIHSVSGYGYRRGEQALFGEGSLKRFPGLMLAMRAVRRIPAGFRGTKISTVKECD